jgi:predicted lipid-binding transport protein (Tim44 family)
MAGPYPPPPPPGDPRAYPQAYPAALPPPVGYPGRPRAAMWWALAAAVAALGAVVAAVVAVSGARPGAASAAFSDAAAETAIQEYLRALGDGDYETIARNAACGMFDSLSDRRSDLALARLSSDAFNKQFAGAEVTSVDRIVLSSDYQAQVLFTLRVVPDTGDESRQEQGIAQLLRQDDTLLVCSYLLRTAARF